MNTIMDEFASRVAEVDAYIKVLVRLEDPNVVIFDRSRKRKLSLIGQGSFKVMKATVFLMIYNLVESSIRSGFRSLYEQMHSEGKTVSELRVELRKLWIGGKYQRVAKKSATLQSFEEAATEIVEIVLSQSVAELRHESLPISGNLDADKIRDLCQKHGVVIQLHRQAFGGSELVTVKRQRNALGHGESSFESCGQQYSVSDLVRIKKQAVVFVRGVLKSLAKYINEEQYIA